MFTAPDPEKVLALGNCDYVFGILATFQSLKRKAQNEKPIYDISRITILIVALNLKNLSDVSRSSII